MKKRILSLILVLLLCMTLPVVTAAAATAGNSPISVGQTGLAITTNKDLYLWGQNWYGQVGNGAAYKDAATPFKALSNVEFASTNKITVAITTNKDLYVWGENKFGQVGDGKGGFYERQPSPVKILSNIASVTMDGESVAAITTTGDLYTWGRNQYGQIGNGKSGTDEIQMTPVKVLSNVASVSINQGTVAAVTTNGDLYAWGRNDYAQAGNGKSGTGAVQNTPVKILSNVAKLTSNGGPAAAITTNGDLYCWGTNWFGQVGNGTRDHQTKPVKVLSNVASVSTSSTTFAIATNGDLYGWGYSEVGQVGNGNIDYAGESQTTPVKVLSNVVSVIATYTNSAAITTNGDLYCWGENTDYRIGNGTNNQQATPFKVLSNIASYTNDMGINAAAVTKNGDLYTWGNNADGQIGNTQSGYTDDPLSDGIIQKTPVKVLSNVVSASTIDNVSSAINKSGDLYCWGNNDEGSVGNGKWKVSQSTPVKVLSKISIPSVAAVVPTAEIKATPTASKVLVDGKSVAFDAYNIANNNYFKLRDLAYVLNSSEKKFSVAWDGVNNAIALESGKAYTAVGGEMATKGSSTVNAASSTSVIMLNGTVVKLTAYNIANNNYFKLRDVGIAFDFDVSWSNEAQTIVIDTTSGYTAD